MSSFEIDPDAVLDFAFDWTAWLAEGEAITGALLTPSPGISVDSYSISGGVVTVWLSRATGTRQRVTCRITTDQGRTDDRTMNLAVHQR